jgi:serine/threonine-protein kinase
MLEKGRRIERYVVEGLVGEGGMAHVYRVRHDALGTSHALKVLKVAGPAIQERLVREGRVQASLRHPNIVAVTDVLDVDGSPGLIMEHVDGPSLDVWLQRRRPTLAQVESIFRGILAGVARAHRHGLIHRDLKPGNVLIEEGEDGLVPKVADFGLAKILLEGDVGGVHATRSGVGMGTPAYMSPEQVRDAKGVDARTDIFAMGCILYEMVCGRTPFDGPDVLTIFVALAEGSYEPPEKRVPGLPRPLAQTIRACLMTDRHQRPADCAAVRSLLDGQPPTPPRVLTASPGSAPIAAAALPAPQPTPAAMTYPAETPRVRPTTPAGPHTLGETADVPMSPRPTPRPRTSTWAADSRATSVTILVLAAFVLGTLGVVCSGLYAWNRRSTPAEAPPVADVLPPEPAVPPEQPPPAVGTPERAASDLAAAPNPVVPPGAAPTPRPITTGKTSHPAVSTETTAEPEPPPEPPAAPPVAPKAPEGRFSVVGAEGVRLLGSGHSWRAGEDVPVGEYDRVRLPDGTVIKLAQPVVIREGESAILRCDTDQGRCAVSRH